MVKRKGKDGVCFRKGFGQGLAEEKTLSKGPKGMKEPAGAWERSGPAKSGQLFSRFVLKILKYFHQ